MLKTTCQDIAVSQTNSESEHPLPRPKAYLIAEVEVTDHAAYEIYTSAVVPIVAQYGGEYIVRGGQTASFEGEAPKGRLVIIAFANMSAAQAFLISDEYRPIADIRHKNAVSRIMIVEGVIP
ncbi:DUF1330 domain-containing protein [Sphingorhabdus sp. EL138]|uniref:DUF1330 domain-containing protein n=1 Tax=Sphingorhabdus sp. EL138 TaxID=2073156 RepID=UPI0025D45E5E|nr:DUF1330 domain-containing protein [Sphingorhabdus sp. EL138]